MSKAHTIYASSSYDLLYSTMLNVDIVQSLTQTWSCGIPKHRTSHKLIRLPLWTISWQYDGWSLWNNKAIWKCYSNGDPFSFECVITPISYKHYSKEQLNVKLCVIPQTKVWQFLKQIQRYVYILQINNVKIKLRGNDHK